MRSLKTKLLKEYYKRFALITLIPFLYNSLLDQVKSYFMSTQCLNKLECRLWNLLFGEYLIMAISLTGDLVRFIKAQISFRDNLSQSKMKNENI